MNTFSFYINLRKFILKEKNIDVDFRLVCLKTDTFACIVDLPNCLIKFELYEFCNEVKKDND